MKSAVIFTKCLGLNDQRAFGTQKTNHKTGATELIDCLNVTTTADGAIEKIPAFVNKMTHTAPITNVSARERLLFQDGINTHEWNGTAITNPLPLTDGPILHTPIDCRVSTLTTNYKSVNATLAMSAATVGTNPNPATSRTFAAMPLFESGFVLNGKAYVVNRTDKRFLQYSEDYHYDLFNLGDGFLGFGAEILQAGAIGSGQKDMLGCLLATHAHGVTVLAGTGPADFMPRKFPCEVIDKTLFSGHISETLGFGHVFLCRDGVYVVNSDGMIVNLTSDRTDYLYSRNNTYYGALVDSGKYLAVGDLCTVEYDFSSGSVLLRSSFGVTAATSWRDTAYFAQGNSLVGFDTEIDDTANFPASVTFPFSYWGAEEGKSVVEFYLTGIVGGEMEMTLTDDNGKSWTHTESALGRCTNYRIKPPKAMMGGHVSLEITCPSGQFRLEELRVNYAVSTRTR